MQLTFILTYCFAKYDFLVDVLSLQSKRTIKTTREFITEVGIALAEVILELPGSFTLERRPFRYLSRGNLCQSMSLFNKAVLYMIFQFAGDFFPSHHVGFPLSPFTDLLCIHGYHSTLYTVEPELKLVLQNTIFSQTFSS